MNENIGRGYSEADARLLPPPSDYEALHPAPPALLLREETKRGMRLRWAPPATAGSAVGRRVTYSPHTYSMFYMRITSDIY